MGSTTRPRWVLAAAALIVAATSLGTSIPAWADGPAPRATVIGDSSMITVLWHGPARQILERGLDLRLDVEVCRRLVGQSCPFEGQRPPNLVDAVTAMGTGLGVAVVVGGYNEPEEEFPAAVVASVGALVRAGATRILWPTLSEASPMLGRMNGVLQEIAEVHPELTLLDWNRYSADRNDWFQTDHIHLTHAGAEALASFLRIEIERALAGTAPLRPAFGPPPLVILAPPAVLSGREGRPFRALLAATGGAAPYRWAVASGSLPGGLRVSGSWIRGTPAKAGRTRLTVRVVDASGAVATQQVTLAVGRQPAREVAGSS